MTILGTDINRDFLAHAQRGEFTDWSFRSAPADLQTSCFTRSGANWLINQEFRGDVSFQYHNLVQHPFPSLVNNLAAFDLILCRNVMIYFDAPIVQRLIGQFYDCLVEEGWFVVGHAEPNVELFRAFRTVNATGVVLYQRGQRAPLAGGDWPLPRATWPATLPTPAAAAWTPPDLTAIPRALPAASTDRQPAPAKAAPAVSLADIRTLLDRGAWEAAGEACRRLEIAERLNPVWHLYQALLAEQLGQHAGAEQALRRAIYLDRNFVLGHYYLGLWQLRNHDTAAAGRCLRNVLTLLAGRPEAETFADADGLTVGGAPAALANAPGGSQPAMNARREIDWDEVRCCASRSSNRRWSAARASIPTGSRGFTPKRATSWRRGARDERPDASWPALVFVLGGERYCLAVAALVEILPFARYSPVPGGPPELLGVTSVRGEIRSVLDLAHLLALPGEHDASRGYIVLVRHAGQEIGLRVDAVERIESIAPESLLAIDGQERTGEHPGRVRTPGRATVLTVEEIFSRLDRSDNGSQ